MPTSGYIALPVQQLCKGLRNHNLGQQTAAPHDCLLAQKQRIRSRVGSSSWGSQNPSWIEHANLLGQLRTFASPCLGFAENHQVWALSATSSFSVQKTQRLRHQGVAFCHVRGQTKALSGTCAGSVENVLPLRSAVNRCHQRQAFLEQVLVRLLTWVCFTEFTARPHRGNANLLKFQASAAA